MKKNFSIFILLAVIFLITGMTAYAQESVLCQGNGPDRLLRTKIDQILDVLENKTLSQDAKEVELQAIVDPIFNYPLMAKLTLGRKYWSALSQEQQNKFTDLFIKKLKNSYFDKISLYSGNVHANVVCHSAEPEGKKAIVPVTVQVKDTTIDMRYSFYRFPDGWKAYDVEIKGVSIVSSYRAQFDQVLRHGTVDDLLNALKSPSLPGAKQPKTEQAAKKTGTESDVSK